MATKTSAPTRLQPFVDDKGKITLRASEWFNLVNLSLPIEGTGNPEGIVEARIGQEFIDTSADFVSAFLYRKQFNDISGDRKKGWRLVL